jgi:methanogenic corrinoid protein MtbC1
MDSQLATAVADLDEDAVFALLRAELDAGTDPSLLLGMAREGMTVVGERFESGEYYLSDLIMSGELFKQIAQMVVAESSSDGAAASRATVVIATVEGDVHDIGKDIVVNLLRGANYNVVDLGVDVPAARVAKAVEESGAAIVGLSGLLTIAFDPMKQSVEAVRALGQPVKIMVGGAPVTEAVREYVGADALGADALDAVRLADEWTAPGRSDI